MWCVGVSRPECALRRARGARRPHSLAHALTESAVPGLIGGLAGASLGVAIVVLVALANHWTPVIAPILLWPAPFARAALAMTPSLIPAPMPALARPTHPLTPPPPPTLA